eukprot:423536_1
MASHTISEQKSRQSNHKTPVSYSKISNDEDLDISDNDYDDDDGPDDIIENNLNNVKKSTTDTDEEEIVRCECCKWMTSYAKAIVFSIFFFVIWFVLFLFVVDEDDLPIILVIEFMFAWFALISLCRLTVHLLIHGWTVYKARKLKWIDRFEAAQNVYFYIEYSKGYMQATIVSILAFMILTSLLAAERYTEVTEYKISADDYYTFKDFMLRTSICFILLFSTLWTKQIFVRWWIIDSYLQPHIESIDKMKQYESWIKILLNNSYVFSIKVKTFLNVHGFGHTRSKRKTAFRVAALLQQNEINLENINSYSTENKLKKIDETIKGNLNTYNSRFMNANKYGHTIETCLLWLYSPK